MEYKGYVAAVEFDDSAGRLHGRVVNSGAYPIATFEATDVDGIRREFQRSIDEYLASCREDGVEPKKPFSGTLNLRLGPDLHQRAALSATAHGVSLNSWIKQAVEEKASRRPRRLENRELIADSRSMSQLGVTACHSSACVTEKPGSSSSGHRLPHVDLAGDRGGDQGGAEFLQVIHGLADLGDERTDLHVVSRSRNDGYLAPVLAAVEGAT